MALKLGRLISVVSLIGLFLAFPKILLAEGSTDVTGTVPLVASSVKASGITPSEAAISWDTNGNASSQIFYDTAAHVNISDYSHSNIVSPDLVMSHSVLLTGLMAGATYHYRVKSVMSDPAFFAISDDNTFTTLTPSGGGGGGFGNQLVGIGLSGTSPFMDGNGKSITTGLIGTADGKLTLSIPVGVFIWNATGAAQPFLSANSVDMPPAAPAQQKLIRCFELGPSGVTFNPAISVIFNYTSADLSGGVSESSLYVAWWNGSAWVKLASTVDTTAKTVTAAITHFTTFGLFSQTLQQTTVPPTTVPPKTTTTPPTTTTVAPPETTTGPTTTPADNTKTNWAILTVFLVAALVLGIFFWRGQRPNTKLRYTNMKK